MYLSLKHAKYLLIQQIEMLDSYVSTKMIITVKIKKVKLKEKENLRQLKIFSLGNWDAFHILFTRLGPMWHYASQLINFILCWQDLDYDNTYLCSIHFGDDWSQFYHGFVWDR